jgi:hypothetical protein
VFPLEIRTAVRGALAAALLCAAPLAASAGDLTLSMQNGRVTIVARDVTVRQILQEWARVGNVRIVNAEKVMGAPVTLQLVDMPESQALDTLLRTAAGYMAVPRPGTIAGASLYDRIVILAASRAPAAGAAPPPQFTQPQPQQVLADDDDEPVNIAPPGMPPLTLPRPPNPNVTGGEVERGAQPTPNVPPVITAPRPGALPTPPQPPGEGYQPPVVPPVTRKPGGPGENNDR